MTKTKDDSLSGLELYFDDPEQFVTEMPYPAMIKDRAGKYVLTNQKCADLFGLSANEIVGLSVGQLECRVDNEWERGYGKAIELLDFAVLSKGVVEKDYSRILPVNKGFLRVQDTIKYPILTPITKRVSGIITFSYDKTHEVGLYKLFRLYVKFYKCREKAISLFLREIKVNKLFHTLPSIREVETVIHIVKSYQYSTAAEKMGIKVKTLDKNVLSLKNKMLSPELFSVMVEMIRQNL